MVEDPVRDPIGQHILQDVLDRVQLWRPRRQLPVGGWRLYRGPWGGVLIPRPQETWHWGFQLGSLTFGIDPGGRGHGRWARDIGAGRLDRGPDLECWILHRGPCSSGLGPLALE